MRLEEEAAMVVFGRTPNNITTASRCSKTTFLSSSRLFIITVILLSMQFTTKQKMESLIHGRQKTKTRQKKSSL
jgi:hypothetical protein